MITRVTIPMVPPSVNHYVKHFRNGAHVVQPAAKSFKYAVAMLSKDCEHFTGKKTTYTVTLGIFLGPKQKGDIDNFPKVVLDSLKDAGIIHTDAAVKHLHVSLARDHDNPRTEIEVEAHP